MTLANPTTFFDSVRSGLLGPTLSDSEVSGCTAILTACAAWPLSWAAYGLATPYLETAHTMRPVREHGGADYFRRMYDPLGNRPHVAAGLGNIHPGDGVTFSGRGYVQLTGRANYARAELELSIPLVAEPDLALKPVHAAAIMERGMRTGWFTGRKLSDFLPAAGPGTRAEFIAARRIINGNDRAGGIADFALQFQEALKLGGWA